MDNHIITINKENLIHFLNSKIILGLTLNDSVKKVESIFKNKNVNKIHNKYFSLISYKNVEFTITNNKINTIHIENGIVEGRSNIINFDIEKYEDIKNEIDDKIEIIHSVYNKEILLPDCKLYFNKKSLYEIFFE